MQQRLPPRSPDNSCNGGGLLNGRAAVLGVVIGVVSEALSGQ